MHSMVNKIPAPAKLDGAPSNHWLIKYRWKPSLSGLVVKADSHKGERLHHAQPVLQAPSEQTRVPRRDEDARPQKRIGICDERLDIGVLLAQSVSIKSQQSGIPYDFAISLGDNRCPLFDGVVKIAATVVTVHALAKPVALFQIRHKRSAYVVTRSRDFDRRALHRRYRLTNVKSELRIKRQRSVVKGRLQKAGALEAAFRGALQHCIHKRASDAPILNRWIDGNRPYASNRRAFVQTVATENLPARFRHHTIETRMRKHHRKNARRCLN